LSNKTPTVALNTTKGLRTHYRVVCAIWLNRETLYRTLSENGNPRLSSLGLIIEALGLRLSIESPDGGP
jgi:DNA-binding phage protein